MRAGGCVCSRVRARQRGRHSVSNVTARARGSAPILRAYTSPRRPSHRKGCDLVERPLAPQCGRAGRGGGSLPRSLRHGARAGRRRRSLFGDTAVRGRAGRGRADLGRGRGGGGRRGSGQRQRRQVADRVARAGHVPGDDRRGHTAGGREPARSRAEDAGSDSDGRSLTAADLRAGGAGKPRPDDRGEAGAGSPERGQVRADHRDVRDRAFPHLRVDGADQLRSRRTRHAGRDPGVVLQRGHVRGAADPGGGAGGCGGGSGGRGCRVLAATPAAGAAAGRFPVHGRHDRPVVAGTARAAAVLRARSATLRRLRAAG